MGALTPALAAVGGSAMRGATAVGHIVLLTLGWARSLTHGLALRATLREMHRLGRLSLPVLLASAVVIGCIAALLGLGYVRRYNATEVFGWAAALSCLRDVAPMLLAFAAAARLGAQNAAETASMVVREKLDALAALRVDAVRMVLVPRVLAIFLVALLAFPPMTTVALLVSYVFAALLGGPNIAVSVGSFLEYLDGGVIVGGLLRMASFALFIAVASTAAGLSAAWSRARSARSVGSAVFRGSVWCLSSIVAANLLWSLAGSAS